MIDDILTSRYSNESLLLYVVHNISRSCIVAYVRANENTATHRWTPVTLRLNRVSWSVLNNRTHLRTYRQAYTETLGTCTYAGNRQAPLYTPACPCSNSQLTYVEVFTVTSDHSYTADG